jgi:hypothetical protein
MVDTIIIVTDTSCVDFIVLFGQETLKDDYSMVDNDRFSQALNLDVTLWEHVDNSDDSNINQNQWACINGGPEEKRKMMFPQEETNGINVSSSISSGRRSSNITACRTASECGVS